MSKPLIVKQMKNIDFSQLRADAVDDLIHSMSIAELEALHIGVEPLQLHWTIEQETAFECHQIAAAFENAQNDDLPANLIALIEMDITQATLGDILKYCKSRKIEPNRFLQAYLVV